KAYWHSWSDQSIIRSISLFLRLVTAPVPDMKTSRIDIGSIRREQIIEAAVAIIAEQGLQNLSLSEIEQRAGMSRGQLTYYFPAKEDILLAVFDRLLEMMHQRAQGDGKCPPCAVTGTAWDRLRHFLSFLVLTPLEVPE